MKKTIWSILMVCYIPLFLYLYYQLGVDSINKGLVSFPLGQGESVWECCLVKDQINLWGYLLMLFSMILPFILYRFKSLF